MLSPAFLCVPMVWGGRCWHMRAVRTCAWARLVLRPRDPWGPFEALPPLLHSKGVPCLPQTREAACESTIHHPTRPRPPAQPSSRAAGPQVNDYRTDVVLKEACELDVAKFCQDIKPGAFASPWSWFCLFFCACLFQWGRGAAALGGGVRARAAEGAAMRSCCMRVEDVEPASAALHCTALRCAANNRSTGCFLPAQGKRASGLLGAGEGNVHACLRQHMEELSEGCRAQELKLSIIQAGGGLAC